MSEEEDYDEEDYMTKEWILRNQRELLQETMKNEQRETLEKHKRSTYKG